MTTEPFTPHTDSIQTAWVLMCQQSRIATQPPVEELEAEYDRFLTRVRRDAAREALDGLIDAWLGKYGTPETRDAGIAVRDYREMNYRLPEENPVTVQPTRDQLRALANAATPGPWKADHGEEDNSSVKEVGREWWDGLAFAGRPDDAEFIAAARNVLPQLLDQLDRAEHRIARLEAQTSVRGRAVVMYRERAREAEARIKAVEDALDAYAYTGIYTGQERVAVSDIRRALDGDA